LKLNLQTATDNFLAAVKDNLLLFSPVSIKDEKNKLKKNLQSSGTPE